MKKIEREVQMREGAAKLLAGFQEPPDLQHPPSGLA